MYNQHILNLDGESPHYVTPHVDIAIYVSTYSTSSPNGSFLLYDNTPYARPNQCSSFNNPTTYLETRHPLV